MRRRGSAMTMIVQLKSWSRIHHLTQDITSDVHGGRPVEAKVGNHDVSTGLA